MKQEVKASVQYGDLQGEVSCDGHMGPFLHDLAEKASVSSGYFPIAVSVSVYKGEVGGLYVHIFACDEKRYGSNIDQIRKKGIEEGEIEVKKFDATINIKELMALIKRLDIFAKDRAISDVKITTHDPL